MPEPNRDNRQEPLRAVSLRRLAAAENVDVLILGGGVNGVGLLRDLALNGVSVVLIDSADFCSGASGASSRMAHGGLRYLEGREFRLVAESTRERNILIAKAPHVVKPLEIVVPQRSLTQGLGRAIGRFLKISPSSGPLSLVALEGALLLYEFLGRRTGRLPRHRTRLRRAGFPDGMPAATRAVTSYYDGQITQPEGLVMEILVDAMAANDRAVALNYTDWFLQEDGFELSDQWSGARFHIRPRLVVNATGAWIDRVNARLGISSAYLRGVKGAHLVLDHEALYRRMAGQAYYFDDGTGRMVITLPVGSNVLVGTTEVETVEPDDREIDGAEVDYLLRAIDGLFDDIDVDRTHIVSMTTGIRPLRRDSSLSATAVTRDHVGEVDHIPNTELPVLSLIGGKWTTFRAFAEQTADQILDRLGMLRHVSTATRDYPGAAPCTLDALCCAGDCEPARAALLLERYGALALQLAGSRKSSLDRPLVGNGAYTLAEIEWLIDQRAACTIEDLVLRRTQLSQGHGVKVETLRDLGTILTDRLGRDPDEIALEISRAMADPRIVGSRATHEEAA